MGAGKAATRARRAARGRRGRRSGRRADERTWTVRREREGEGRAGSGRAFATRTGDGSDVGDGGRERGGSRGGRGADRADGDRRAVTRAARAGDRPERRDGRGGEGEVGHRNGSGVASRRRRDEVMTRSDQPWPTRRSSWSKHRRAAEKPQKERSASHTRYPHYVPCKKTRVLHRSPKMYITKTPACVIIARKNSSISDQTRRAASTCPTFATGGRSAQLDS